MRFNAKRKILSWMLAAALCVTTALSGQAIYAQENQPERTDETQEVVTEEILPAEEMDETIDPKTEEEPMEDPQDDDWITAEDLGQIAEKSADSWRYDDGMMSEDAMDYNAQLGSTMEEPPLRAAKGGYGTTNSKSWTYKYDGKSVTCSGGYLKGIDISYWQGNINWDKVKTVVDNGGLDFVIIRCGWGVDSTNKDDSKFARNVSACEARNIPYGVYLYSYAKSQSEALSEANHTLRLLKNHYPNYPVYYDLEDKSILNATGKSKSKITGFARTYCSTLANNGYKAGVYANLNWFKSYIDESALKNEGYDLWLAQWMISKGEHKYSGLGHGSKYTIWQCCSYGTISGISGRVDLNLLVRPFSEIENYMADRVPATLQISAPDKTLGYIKVSSATTKYGPGNGYRSTPVKLGYATELKIIGMVGSYYQLEQKDGDRNLWVAKTDVAAPTEAYAVRSAADEEGNAYNYIEAFNGDMIISAWSTILGKTYYSTETGTLATGVKKIGNYIYGFDSTGFMYRSTSQWFGCKRYTFDSAGKAYLKQAKTKKKSVYRTGPGTKYAKKGTLKKKKAIYVVRTSGSWSQMPNGYWVKNSTIRATAIYPVYKPETNDSYRAVLKAKYKSRSGPGTSYIKKKTYKKGAKITVSGTYGGWAKLTSGYWVPISKVKAY